MKKTIAFLGCALVAAFCVSSASVLPLSAAGNSYIRGDADGDGVVTINDVTMIQRVLSQQLEDTDGSVARRGCVTGEVLSIVDATEIQQYLAEQTNTLHIGETVTEEQPTTEAQPTTQSQTQPTTRYRDPYELPFIPVR